MNIFVESLKVAFGAFLSTSLISGFISASLVLALCVGVSVGSIVGLVTARHLSLGYSEE